MPALADAYVNPDFRLAEYEEQADPSAEWWWERVEPSDDIVGFLARYFTSPEAATMPLVVLGQPGAGKSVLTKILAGRLPDGDFLPVRVPLREVPADGTIQEQIEAAVRIATGEHLSWPDLARSANGALPVVMLDGLDELLQATGVHRSDYLSQVAEFQRRETELGRPLIVLVTTRTAVADRMRFPRGCLMIRLEPFKEEQVRRRLSVWNAANQEYFTAQGLQPLPPETALEHGELASQPLLLLMLALYDADANALQRGETELSQAELYERLLTRFARREVRKHQPGLPDEQIEQAVETELRTLAVAAFAMFNRGRQWATTDDLNSDLAALLPAPVAQTATFQAPLSRADRVIGKFFFVHQASAERDGGKLQTYEFLHATFGEYLIARMTRDVLRSMVARETAPADPFFGRPQPDDGLLYALLSFSVLTERQPIVKFLRDLLPALDREPTVDLLVRLLNAAESRTDQSYPDYRPRPSTFVTRYAYYTANLVTLASLITKGVAVSELFPYSEAPTEAWWRLATLWHSRLSGEAFTTMCLAFQIESVTRGDASDMLVRYGSDTEHGWTVTVMPRRAGELMGGLAEVAEPLVIANALTRASVRYEPAAQPLAEAWRFTEAARITIRTITDKLRLVYLKDPEGVAEVFREVTGEELPEEVTRGAADEGGRSKGGDQGRNDAIGERL